MSFAALTGLAPAAAAECVEACGGSEDLAVVSFVQSYPLLPEAVFGPGGRAASEGNAAQLNERVQKSFAAVRAVIAEADVAEASAWTALARSGFDVAKAVGSLRAPVDAPAAAPAFGFGAAASGSAQPAPPVGFGQGPNEGATKVVEKPKKGGPPPQGHFVGPFFDMPHFWDAEVIERAPLLNKNEGFLERNRDVLRERLLKWVKVSEFHDRPVEYIPIEDEDEETVRVIIKDAVRTFFQDEHRVKFHRFLYSMFIEFGHYGQAMSYVAGLCMLVLNEQETATVLRKVAKEYIPKHWAAEAVGFATNAWLIERVMRNHHKDVTDHFNKLNFWPDTYLQKIISGLCVHVLPFDQLFRFLDAFMAGGFPYLVRFAIAMVGHFRARLLAITEATQMNELFEIMRLDRVATDVDDVEAILAAAPLVDLGEDLANLDVMRMEVYDEKVGPRLQKAAKTLAFEPCTLCEVSRPTLWCDDCGAICAPCADGHKGGHAADHSVEKY